MYISIFGYYGFENTGDDSVLYSLLQDIRIMYSDAKIVVFSNYPQKTECLYQKFRIHAVPWDDFYMLNLVIRESNLLIIGGGGLYNCYLDYPAELFLKGNHRYFSITTFGLPYLAELWNTPCMICGVGASEIYSDAAREHIGNSLEKCQCITVRDEKTKDILLALPGGVGIEHDKIKVTADPVFRLQKEQTKCEETELNWMFDLDKLPRPIIGIALRRWDFRGSEKRTVEAISGCINLCHQKYGGSIVFLPFDKGGVLENLSEDQKVIDQVISRMDADIAYLKIDDYLKPQIALRVIEKCDLMVAMRLHPIVMSIANAIPVVGIEYDQKVRNVMQDCGLEEYCVAIEDITAESLFKTCSFVLSTRIKQQIKDISARLMDKAFQNIECMAQILNQTTVKDSADYLINMLKNIFTENIDAYFADLMKESVEERKYTEYKRYFTICEENNRNPQYVYWMGYSLHQLGQYEEALKYYEKAEAEGFDRFWIYYNRAQLFMALGKREQALDELKKARGLDDTNPDLDTLLLKVKNVEVKY